MYYGKKSKSTALPRRKIERHLEESIKCSLRWIDKRCGNEKHHMIKSCPLIGCLLINNALCRDNWSCLSLSVCLPVFTIIKCSPIVFTVFHYPPSIVFLSLKITNLFKHFKSQWLWCSHFAPNFHTPQSLTLLSVQELDPLPYSVIISKLYNVTIDNVFPIYYDDCAWNPLMIGLLD